MNNFVKNCLVNIAKNSEAISVASQGINTAVVAILGYSTGQQDARDLQANMPNAVESLNCNTQVENETQNVVSAQSLIEVIKEMIIELKLKGSVRERENGLIEFRSQQLGSTYGRDENEIKEKLIRKIRALKSHVKKPQPKNKKKFPLFSEFYLQRYLPYKQGQKRAKNTLKGIEYNYKYIIERGFDKPLNGYTAKDIKDFLFAIERTRKRQIMQGMLNNIFKYAVSESLLMINPCTAIEKMEHDTNFGTSFSFAEQARYFKRLFADEKISYEHKCYCISAIIFLHTWSAAAETKDLMCFFRTRIWTKNC